ASMGTFMDLSSTQADYVATYRLNGFIAQEQKRDELLANVRDNENIRAFIMHIDSPGGTVVGGESLYKRLREINEKKPVIAVIHTLGTSAAYMAALGSERIYAQYGSITGSVG